MNNNHRTFIHFDYGGYYLNKGDEIQWISREDIRHAILIKSSIEEVTYFALVDNNCRKIMVDVVTTEMKFSYMPVSVTPKKPIYIFDDDDLLCYLEWNQSEFNVLHVELENAEEGNQGCDQHRVGEIGETVEIGASNEELISSARTRRVDDGIMTLYVGETCEHHELDDSAWEEQEHTCNVAWEEQEHTGNDDMREGTKVNVEWEDGVNLTIGEEFRSKKAVQDLLEKSAHRNCFEFAIVKSDTKLYVVKCSESKKGCKWSLRVAKLKNSDCFSVRTYNKMHTCYRSTTSTNQNKRKGTSRLVASVLREDYPCKLKTPVPKDLISLVQSRAGVKVSYSTAWRGKKEAACEVRRSLEESYKMLYSYMYMLEMANPRTISFVELDEKKNFQYLFFALGACIEGFDAMRKVIIVDGTHLKTVQGGVLIVASAQDPNHHHYPIAFGVVESEQDASWSWFFNKLKSVVPDVAELVFVSDRNQSLIKSIREVYPLSQHGYCIYHLAQNVKGACSNTNKDTVVSRFIQCARCYTEAKFKKLYGDFRVRYPAGATYLDNHVEEKKWARCYFPGARYNIDTSNYVESINSVFKDARKLSLLLMIDAIVEKLGEWFNEHGKTSADAPGSQMMVPLVENELYSRCGKQRCYRYELNSFLMEYNVIGVDSVGYLVNLKNKTCSCKLLDIDKYPCVHAVAVVMEAAKKVGNEIQLHDLCSKYYWMEQWSLAYYRTIYPVPHMSQWVIPEGVRDKFAFPPVYAGRKKKGRPQITRFPSVGEHRGRKQKSTGRLYEYFQNDGSQS